MKLLLCSEGFHTPNTVQACADLCGKPKEEISVAVINEAFAFEENDKRWVLHNLNCAADNFGGYFDIIDLLALPLDEVERRIGKCDVLFVIGGNSEYLKQTFDKTGFAQLLPKILETKVYVGSSAGSMVLGKRISSEAYRRVFGERNDFGNTAFLGLVDLAVIPHLGSPDLPGNREETLQEVAQDMPFPVYGLRDDSAVIVDGDKIQFIGSTPFEIEPTRT